MAPPVVPSNNPPTSGSDDHFRKLERMYAAAPINRYFAPQLRVRHGEAEVSMSVRDDFHHAAGAMHGSVYFKALDDATFFAANSLVQGVFVLTASFEIEFLAPVSQGNVRATGRVVNDSGRRIQAVGELFDDAGTLIARGRGAFARSRIALSSEVRYG